jgi:hypothetical protein
LIKEHAFSPQDVARVASKNPADFVNRFLEEGEPPFGKIEVGYSGSFTILKYVPLFLLF